MQVDRDISKDEEPRSRPALKIQRVTAILEREKSQKPGLLSLSTCD